VAGTLVAGGFFVLCFLFFCTRP